MDGSSLFGVKADEGGDFQRWMANARAGDRATYYIGFLALGIGADGQRLSEGARKDASLIAQAAWAAGDRGLVHLFQRRRAENCFEYLAVARGRVPR